MSEKYRFDDPHGTYFTTQTIVGWVDVFTRPELKMIVIDSLRFCQREKGLHIHAWCLMTSHLHMIISAGGGPDLSSILRDFKKFTSKQIVTAIDRPAESRRGWMLPLFSDVADGLNRVTGYKVWQDGNHPEILFKKRFTEQKLRYIHENPVAEWIVENSEDYLYSSARDYYTNRKGLLDVDFI